MKPQTPIAFKPRLSRLVPLALCCMLALPGCLSLWTAPEQHDVEQVIDEEAPRIKYVGDAVRPWGTNYLKVEAVALVTKLAGTGSDPPPSSQRQVLVEEMKTRGVRKPNTVLASNETAMAIVRAYLPPGAQKGDPLDVEVRTPAKSDTTSLRDGWLMRARLQELALLGGQIRSGRVLALAEGPILVEALTDGADDGVLEKRGWVLGGGHVLKTRKLGLILPDSAKSVQLSSQIGTAVNRRFHWFDHGIKQGVAKPMRDNFIELAVHPTYRHNLSRYLAVVRSIVIREGTSDQALRIDELGPEALADLGDERAIRPLSEATAEPAFRGHALTALGAMDDARAADALVELLHGDNDEVRYGAFTALQAINSADPMVKPVSVEGDVYLHRVVCQGPAMIHFTRRRRPEVVIFGTEVRLKTPLVVFAGKRVGRQLIVKGIGRERIRISRIDSSGKDRHEECSTDLADVIRTMTKLGAGYSQIVHMLQQAKRQQVLDARVVVDALPQPGRTYKRPGVPEELKGEDKSVFSSLGDLPRMFNSAPAE